MAIDLHAHSTASDGTEKPSAIVRMAVDRGLTALALTDHDTLDGIGAARRAAGHSDLELISGTELSLQYDAGGMHLIVLWLEPGSGPLQDRLADLQSSRADRNRRIIELLNTHAISISIDEVELESGEGSVGKPHIAAVMLRKGYVSTIAEAFELWLARGRPGYVGRRLLDSNEAIRLARESGAVPVLAHPHTLNIDRAPQMAELLTRLKRAGLVGLEAFCAGYRSHEREGYADLARRFNLVPSGGSDYHGSYKPGLELGVGFGDLDVPDSILHELRAHAGAG